MGLIRRFKKWVVSKFYVKKKAQERIIAASRYYHKSGWVYRWYGLWLHQRNVRCYPCEVYPYVKIGENFYMPHCVGVVIGKTAVIGNNVKIYPNVVIGAKLSTHSKHPVGRQHAIVGDDCLLGANSVILGNIVLGKNVTVAAGSVVDIDVPDNSLVYGHNKIRQKQI